MFPSLPRRAVNHHAGMTEGTPDRQPGDLILDRYMPHATMEEREAARENLRAFAAVVVGIAKRLAQEEREGAIRATGGCGVDLEQRPLPHP